MVVLHRLVSRVVFEMVGVVVVRLRVRSRQGEVFEGPGVHQHDDYACVLARGDTETAAGHSPVCTLVAFCAASIQVTFS